jgi:hypothetical protein
VCNNRLSRLEGQAKEVVEAFLAFERVSVGDLPLLPDWFDKVRIGPRHALLTLNRNAVSLRCPLPRGALSARAGIVRNCCTLRLTAVVLLAMAVSSSARAEAKARHIDLLAAGYVPGIVSGNDADPWVPYRTSSASRIMQL